MRVKEYLELAQVSKFTSVTFIKARARENANAPGYHAEYQTTPIWTVEEWSKCKIMDYIVLNDKQAPIVWLSGGKNWDNWFKSGRLLSLLVISEDDLKLLYPGDNADALEEYLDVILEECIDEELKKESSK